MHSELFKIPFEVGGVPIFGFGVLLLLWAIASAITIGGLVRRFGWTAETWSALPMLLLLGVIIYKLPSVFHDGLPIRGYGVMLLAGIVSGVAMAAYRARKGGLDAEVIISLAFWLVISGVIGARLFYVVEYWDEKFARLSLRDTLLEVINVPQGGLVIYGGFLGAAAGFTAFVRKHGLPFLAMADLIAPSMMIGLALGRIGCLLNGCCYGGPTDWPWAVTFPQGSPPYMDQVSRGELIELILDSSAQAQVFVAQVDADSAAAAAGLKPGDVIQAINGNPIDSLAKAWEAIFAASREQAALQIIVRDGRSITFAPVIPSRSRPVHPTQVYSAIDAGLLGWLLWSFFPFRSRDGQCLALLLTTHPVTRFLLEVIRTDEPAVFGTGLSISQNISIALLACAVVLWWYVLRKPVGVTWPLVSAEAARSAGSASAGLKGKNPAKIAPRR
jgi:phosphatidylglycerol:prolipoprotein diacylglycerol transferase